MEWLLKRKIWTNEFTLLKMTRGTRYFKKGQRVWMVFGTGALAALAAGRWQGRGRWVKGWVHFADKKTGKGFHGRPNCCYIGKVIVNDAFAYQLTKVISAW